MMRRVSGRYKGAGAPGWWGAYLMMSLIAWSAAANGFAQWFNWFSYSLLIPPFFLTISFNTLYFIHFLDLPKSHPSLAAISYAMVASGLLLTILHPLFSPGRYMLLYGVSSALWIMAGLTFGLLRLREGYKPARYFVAAFAVVFVGTSVSLLHLFGLPGVPTWQPLLGIALVILTTVITVFVAGRIFRVGILMQGKGASVGEMLRWAIRG